MNGFWFMFFNQAVFDMAKNYEDVPSSSYKAFDCDKCHYETFWHNDVRYIKYGRYVRYLFDHQCVNYFLVGNKVMKDPRK